MSEIIEEEKSIQSFNGYKDNQQNNLSKFTSYQYNIGKMQFKNMEPILEIQISKSLRMILIKEERKLAQAVIQAYHYQHQQKKRQVNLSRVG